ncbi:MAG: hypothetical protein J2P53_09180 [Bradyrhizobiaceae bacterium]|nr:hypothetical protein [Bradyrhizobiaceae bacterium]
MGYGADGPGGLWKKWTIDRPAAFGDRLWEALVVRPAALLDGLTWRQVIASIPVVVLFVAYAHSIPIPPEVVLIGDLLAYIDIFSVLLLVAAISRAGTVAFIVKQATARAVSAASTLFERVQRGDVRHRREGGANHRERPTDRAGSDDEGVAIYGAAWA